MFKRERQRQRARERDRESARARARARQIETERRQTKQKRQCERESKRERRNRGELRREAERESRKTAENIKKEKVIPGIKLRYIIMKLEATTLMRITNPYEDVTMPPISSCCYLEFVWVSAHIQIFSVYHSFIFEGDILISEVVLKNV